MPDAIDPAALDANGYVVSTLQTALYHGLTADSAREAIITAVNMGGDADTVGAITGAIAGARYGAAGLPNDWQSDLRGVTAPELEQLADELVEQTFPAVPSRCE